MSVTVTYKCDRCGAEQPAAEQFWTVCVLIAPHHKHHPHESYERARKDWCRNCMEVTHLLEHPEHIEPVPEIPEKPPTLEDLVREICREEIAEAIQS